MMMFTDKALIVRGFIEWVKTHREIIGAGVAPTPMNLVTWLTETEAGKDALETMRNNAWDISDCFALAEPEKPKKKGKKK